MFSPRPKVEVGIFASFETSIATTRSAEIEIASRVKEIFDQALDVEDPNERQAWLEQVCADEPGVRRQVEVLLRALDNAGDFLVEPATTAIQRGASRLPEAPPRKLGRFEILEELGRGGSGVVFRARDPALNRDVAVKIPRGETLVSQETRERFLREAEAAAGLDHPHLVPVYELGDADGVCFIASAFCPGPDLAKWLSEKNGPLSPRKAAMLVALLAEAIQHAHSRGVLHRDLKPSNILLFPNATGRRDAGGDDLPFTPRIADFGLAKLLESSLRETRTSVILGTPLYMAPEQATGRITGSRPHADIYSLGAILYELLTGKPPFEGETLLSVLDRVRSDEPVPLRRLRPDVPRELETICLKCLRKDPRDRYATAGELAADLQRFLAGQPIHAQPLRLIDHFRIWSHRPERIRDAGMLGISLGIILGTWSMVSTFGGIAQGLIREFSIEIAIQLGFVMLGQHIPMIWIGIETLKNKHFALWAGLILGVPPFGVMILSLFGLVSPFGEIYEAIPFGKWTVNLLLTGLFGAQLFVYAVALKSFHANRLRLTAEQTSGEEQPDSGANSATI